MTAISTNVASTQEVLNGPAAADIAGCASASLDARRWDCQFLVQAKPLDHLADVRFPRAVAELESIAVNQVPDVFQAAVPAEAFVPLARAQASLGYSA